MKIWIVSEEDRGMGVTFEGAYLSEENAKKAVSDSSNLFIEEVEILDK